MTDNLLGYKLLKSAHLSQKEDQMIKGIVTKLKCKNIKSKLRQIDLNGIEISTKAGFNVSFWSSVAKTFVTDYPFATLCWKNKDENL